MKIAINLVGVSSDMENQGKDIKKRNWNATKQFVKDQIIDCWLPNHNVEVFCTTYTPSNSTEAEELVRFYNPTKHQFIKYEFGITTQRSTYIESLKLLLDSDCDFIVSTRFDIEFAHKLSSFNIDFNKVNFLFREGKHWWRTEQFVSDNVFFIPKKYLEAFISAIKLLDEKYNNEKFKRLDMHGVFVYTKQLIGEENTHFLFDYQKWWLSNNNPLYKLHR